MVWRSNINRKACFELFDGNPFILFDTETTGLHPEKGDRITQFAAYKLKAVGNQLGIMKEVNIYIKPPFPVSDKISKVTGLTNAFLFQEKTEDEVFDEIFEFMGNEPRICAYNTKFDVGMMSYMYKRHNKVFMPSLQTDVLEMVRDFVPVESVPNFKQETIARLYGLDRDLTFHNADDDIKATARLLRTMHYEYMTNPEKNSYKRPWIVFPYYLHYRRKETGLYLKLKNNDRLIYNQYLRGWEIKGDKRNPGEIYDMEYVQNYVLHKLNLNSVSDLQKLDEDKFEYAKEIYWFNGYQQQNKG